MVNDRDGWLGDKVVCFEFREREDRKAINKEDFILDKLKDQTIYRLPGSVNGQQFISMFKFPISSFKKKFFSSLVQNCDVSNRNSIIRFFISDDYIEL